MKVLTIVEENRPALLAEITTMLEGTGVNVLDIAGETNGDQAVITLRADPCEACHQHLLEAGYKVFTSEHLLVQIEDHPGALAELSRQLANVEVDIRSIHFISKQAGQCIVALDTDNQWRAGQVLQHIRVNEAQSDGE